MTKILQFILIGLLLATPFVMGGCQSEMNAQEMSENGNGQKQLTNVKVETVQPGSYTNYINLVGTVKANKTIVVSAEESGRLESIKVDKGSRLNRGDTIAKIESSMLEANFNQATAQYELAKLNYNNAKNLYENDGGISETDYLTAQYNMEMAKAQMDAAEERLSNTTISSPSQAIVVNKMVEEGELVGPGTPVVQIMDLSKVKVETGIPENEISYFETGTQAEITLDAYPERTFKGTIRYISPAVDPMNRTFEAEIELPNPDHLLKAEMVVKLRVVKSVYDNAIAISQDALIETETGKAIFVLTDESTAEFRMVKIGPTLQGSVLIQDGLQAGEKLIVVGQRSIADGEKVNVVQ